MKKILKQVFHPFKVIKDYKMNFFLWVLFTVVFGQLGIIINTIVRSKSINATIIQSITLDSISGSFYTYAIALIGSVIGFIFINLAEQEKSTFKTIKIITIVLSITMLIFSSIYYSLSIPIDKNVLASLKNIRIDKPQLFFYSFAIIIAIYTFSIKKMDIDYERYKYLEDHYAQIDNQNVDDILSKSKTLNSDQKGNKL